MNATECYKTIGCNYGGTQMAETLAGLPLIFWIFAILGTSIILAIIVRLKFGNPQ